MHLGVCDMYKVMLALCSAEGSCDVLHENVAPECFLFSSAFYCPGSIVD